MRFPVSAALTLITHVDDMNKALKILLGILVALVVLIGIAAVSMSFVDANRYRPQITARVKQATGRDLAIGDIRFSLFPILGISLKSVQLSNAAGFGAQPQLSVGEAGVGVRLLPLIFGGRVEVGRVQIDDAALDLEVAADGRDNWSDLQQAQAPQAQAATPAASATKPAGGVTSIVVGSIAIHNATVHYNDARSGKYYALEGFDLKTGSIERGKAFDVSLDFHTQSSDPAINTAVTASAQLQVDPQPLHYKLAGLSLHVDGTGAGLPGGKLLLDLKGDIDGGADALSVNGLKLKLDDSTITGRLALASLQPLAAGFTLQIDQIDLDRYLLSSTKAAPAAAAGKASGAAQDSRIPVDALDSVGLDGTLDLGRLQVKGMTITNVHLGAQAPHGAQKHFQLTANLYGGTLGSDTLITPGHEPRYGQSLQLKGIDVGALLRDFTHKDKLEGKGDVDLKFTSAGDTTAVIKRGLNGDLSFALSNAVIKGFNLAQIVRQGQALISGQSPQDNGPQQTDFSAITGGGPIVNGVLHADRLDGRSPLLRLSGQGTVDLVTEAIDYLAQPTVVNSTSGQGGRDAASLNGITVPVHFTGTVEDPHYSIDVRSALQQKAVQKLADKLGQKNPGLSNLLQNFGGLFGGSQQNPQQNNGQPPH